MALLGFFSYKMSVIFLAKIKSAARAVTVEAVSVASCVFVMQLLVFSSENPTCLNSTAIMIIYA